MRLRNCFFAYLFSLFSFQCFSSTTTNQVKQYIKETERQYGLPKSLLVALIEHESSYKITAINPVSEDNAATSYGLGQITLPTAKSVCGIHTKKELMQYHQNIKCTAKILRRHINEYGSVHSALAAYRTGRPCKLRLRTQSVRLCTIADRTYIQGILKKVEVKKS